MQDSVMGSTVGKMPKPLLVHGSESFEDLKRVALKFEVSRGLKPHIQ